MENEISRKSGFFLRAVVHFYNERMRGILGDEDGKALRRSLYILGTLFLLIILFVSGTAADFFQVYGKADYERPSIIYAVDDNGQYIPIAELYRFYRKVIHIGQSEDELSMESPVAQAFISTEDNNFMIHPGIDPQGILRAALVNLIAGRIKEGASTITQQVARLRFLSRERSFFRKAREAFLSVLIELRFTKPEILEMYLNEVPLGHGTIGVQAASKFYFEKPVFDLSWGEAALLASLTTRPNDFSPLKNLQESRSKVRVVIQKLVENGRISVSQGEEEFQKLEKEYYSSLNRSPNDSAFNQRLNLHPYATEYAKYALPSKLKDRLYEGGLRIYTTIRHEHQSAAEEELISHLRTLNRQRRRPPFKNFEAFDDSYGDLIPLIRDLFGLHDINAKLGRKERRFHREFISEIRDELHLLSFLNGDQNIQEGVEYHLIHENIVVEEELSVEGALISMRPDNGDITAVVGGSGFTSSNQMLRFIQSKRQAGSSFKPFVYASGIEMTAENPDIETPLTAATMMDDSPVQFVGQDLSEYSPDNYSGTYEGLISLRKALTLSKNAVAVRIYEYLGSLAVNPVVERILQFRRDGRENVLPREATVALGTFPVSPYEMARAYAVFASGGKEVYPRIISYITDSEGRVLADYRDEARNIERKQLIRPETAEIMTSLLHDVVEKGTGKAARIPGRQVSGKTGTTNRNTDAWFVGYTPELVTAIHVGYDRIRSLGPGGTGGSIAAPVWGRYMYKALRGDPVKKFEFAESENREVEICAETGLLPGPDCREKIMELFAPGTEPVKVSENEPRGEMLDPFDPGVNSKEEVFSAEDF